MWGVLQPWPNPFVAYTPEVKEFAQRWGFPSTILRVTRLPKRSLGRISGSTQLGRVEIDRCSRDHLDIRMSLTQRGQELLGVADHNDAGRLRIEEAAETDSTAAESTAWTRGMYRLNSSSGTPWSV